MLFIYCYYLFIPWISAGVSRGQVEQGEGGVGVRGCGVVCAWRWVAEPGA